MFKVFIVPFIMAKKIQIMQYMILTELRFGFSHLIGHKFINNFEGAFSGLRTFLVTESPLKMMKNVFHFTLKAHFVIEIFKFLS